MPWKEKNVLNLRQEFVLKSLSKLSNFSDLCKEYGISRKTGYKWRKRFVEEGFDGLHDLSRRPHNHSDELSEEVVCRIISLKIRHKFWGPKKIRQLYRKHHGSAPSESSFKRILDRAGLVRHRRKRSRRSSNRLQSNVEVRGSNDLWTVDFKGWWKTPLNQRCEPLTIRDEFSKYILSVKALDNTGGAAVKAEFIRVFSTYGLPKVLRSDNGVPFASSRSPLGLSSLAVWMITLGIELDRIRPGQPQDNGGHERMHRDIAMELEGIIEGDLDSHQESFDLWRHEFNHERPHEALGMKVPADVYRKSSIKYPDQLPLIQYPSSFITRKISGKGIVSLHGRTMFISHSLRHYQIGLRAVTPDNYEVWFDNLLLGHLDLGAEAFIEITPDVLGRG